MIDINIQLRVGPSEELFLIALKTDGIIGITGASGKGKTSFFKAIAGLYKKCNGTIINNEIKWLDSTQNLTLASNKRNIGFVFQDFVLFPNMTALENIQFAQSDQFSKSDLDILLNTFEVDEFIHQNVKKLSGGQQQRISIIRTLVQLPSLILMDEPFSSLDENIKKVVIDYIKKYQVKYKIPILINSHQTNVLTQLTTKIYTFKNHTLEEEIIDHHSKGKVIKIDFDNRLITVAFPETTLQLPYSKNIKIGDEVEIKKA